MSTTPRVMSTSPSSPLQHEQRDPEPKQSHARNVARDCEGCVKSGLGVGLGGRAVELVRDERLVADDPRVVTGLDHVGVSRAGLAFLAVVVQRCGCLPEMTTPTCRAWQLSPPTIGLMHSDHRHPGCAVMRAAFTPPRSTTSSLVLSGCPGLVG